MRNRIRSDDGQTDGQTNNWTEFPLVDSIPVRGRVKTLSLNWVAQSMVSDMENGDDDENCAGDE